MAWDPFLLKHIKVDWYSRTVSLNIYFQSYILRSQIKQLHFGFIEALPLDGLS